MKHIFCLLAFFAIITAFGPNKASAQTIHYHYKYSYDDSGNREKRIYMGTALKSAQIGGNTLQDPKPIVEEIGDREIKIYPNPTKGKLKLEIPFDEHQRASALVYNLSGQLVINKKIRRNSTTLDLEGQPSGMFILKICIGQKMSEWKIIKE